LTECPEKQIKKLSSMRPVIGGGEKKRGHYLGGGDLVDLNSPTFGKRARNRNMCRGEESARQKKNGTIGKKNSPGVFQNKREKKERRGWSVRMG